MTSSHPPGSPSTQKISLGERERYNRTEQKQQISEEPREKIHLPASSHSSTIINPSDPRIFRPHRKIELGRRFAAIYRDEPAVSLIEIIHHRHCTYATHSIPHKRYPKPRTTESRVHRADEIPRRVHQPQCSPRPSRRPPVPPPALGAAAASGRRAPRTSPGSRRRSARGFPCPSRPLSTPKRGPRRLMLSLSGPPRRKLGARASRVRLRQRESLGSARKSPRRARGLARGTEALCWWVFPCHFLSAVSSFLSRAADCLL